MSHTVYPQTVALPGGAQARVRLTRVERRVLTLVADGLNNRQIARQLDYSVGTIGVYITRIHRKLEIRERCFRGMRHRMIWMFFTGEALRR